MINDQTTPTVLDLYSDADRFDLLGPSNRIFWRDMDKATVIQAAKTMGPEYRIIEHTGLGYNAKISRAWRLVVRPV
jgi:hypothetical protein